MEKKSLITSTAEIFTLSLAFVSAFNLLLSGSAEEVKDVSQLFRLCGEGISFIALAELLALSFVIAAARAVWFSERFFKNMMMVNRITFMLISVFVTAGMASVVFGWFPADMWQAWIGFILSFGVGTSVSIGVMMLRIKSESRKYQSKLDSFRNAESGEDDEHE